MNTNKQENLYTEFEPEANEIVFGQKTLPDRPLTDKEKSKRKKIILKLLDQKLKFQLIELMSQQQKLANSSNVDASPIPIMNQTKVTDSNRAHNSTMPPNYQYTENDRPDYNSGPEHQQQKWQPPSEKSWNPPFENTWQNPFQNSCKPPFQSDWQSPVYPEQYETNVNTSWLSQANSSEPNQLWHQNRIKEPPNRSLFPPNTNFVRQSVSSENIKSKLVTTSNATVSAPLASNNSSTMCNEKLTTFVHEPSDEKTFSVNQPRQNNSATSTSYQGSRSDSTIQLNYTTAHRQPLSSETMSFQPSKIRNGSMKQNPQFLKDDSIDANKDRLQQENNLTLKQTTLFPSSSKVQAAKQSTTSTVMEDQSTSIDLTFRSNNAPKRRRRKRLFPYQRNKHLVIEQKADTVAGIEDEIVGEIGNKVDTEAGTLKPCLVNNNSGSKSVTMTGITTYTNHDSKDMVKADIESVVKAPILTNSVPDNEIFTKDGTNGDNNNKIDTNASSQRYRSFSNDWNKLHELVTIICRNDLNHSEPLSPRVMKLKNAILIQTSFDPNLIRSNELLIQKVGTKKLEQFINECKIIVSNVSRAAPEIKTNFSASRDNFIKSIKEENHQRFDSVGDSVIQLNHTTTRKRPLSSETIPFQPLKMQNESMKQNPLFLKDDSFETNKDRLQQENNATLKQPSLLPSSSNSQAVKQSTTFAVMEDQSTSIDLTFESNDAPKRRRRRKRLPPHQRNQRLLIEQKANTMEGIEDEIVDKIDNKVDTEAGTSADTMTHSLVSNSGSKIGVMTITTYTNHNSKYMVKGDNEPVVKAAVLNRSFSKHWNKLYEMVTIICRNDFNHSEPLSPRVMQLKNEILIQTSFDPNLIRSNEMLIQKVGKKKLEQFINECQIVLANVSRAAPQIKTNFAASRDQFIKSLKGGNYQRDTSNESRKLQLAHTKIANIVNPFLKPEEKNRELISRLITNPYELEANGILKSRITGKNLSVNDIMRQIKEVLDSHIHVRPPKKFNMQPTQYFDVPFVVNLYQKSGKMTSEYATELRGILFDSITCLKVNPKPQLRDVTFSDGSLTVVCINRMSFDWLEKTISNHLYVKILPVKNIISKNELKTICLKFYESQYFHFNNLMEQLKLYNPRLLTRRWELRSPQRTNVDPTKCLYVGVDVESLIVLEQMNRIGTFRKSSISFEISYDDNENNFELINLVKTKKRKQQKSVSVL